MKFILCLFYFTLFNQLLMIIIVTNVKYETN